MLTIDGVEIELYYDMNVWADVEENVGMLPEVEEWLRGKKRFRALMGLICCMSRGKVTLEWLNEHMKLADYGMAVKAVSECMKKAYRIEEIEKKTESAI